MGLDLLRVPFFGIGQPLTTPRAPALPRSAALRRAMIFRSQGARPDVAVVRDHELSHFVGAHRYSEPPPIPPPPPPHVAPPAPPPHPDPPGIAPVWAPNDPPNSPLAPPKLSVVLAAVPSSSALISPFKNGEPS